MKQNWQKILIVLTFIISIVNFVCIINLYDMTETEISRTYRNLENRISGVESSIGNISYNVKNAIEEGNSIIASHSFETVSINSKDGTAVVAMSVLPKEYTPETEVSVNINNKICETEFKNGSYYFETEIPMFETIYAADITITENNVNKTEKIDYYLCPGSDYKAYVYGGFSGKLAPAVIDKNALLSLDGQITIDVTFNSYEHKLKDKWSAYFVSDGKIIKTLEGEFSNSYDQNFAFDEIEISETFDLNTNKELSLYVAAQDTEGFYHVTLANTFFPESADPKEVHRIYSSDGKLLYEEPYY